MLRHPALDPGVERLGLLERERRGTYAYYRIAPEALDRLRGLFA